LGSAGFVIVHMMKFLSLRVAVPCDGGFGLLVARMIQEEHTAWGAVEGSAGGLCLPNT
jgi:hypothetical protein